MGHYRGALVRTLEVPPWNLSWLRYDALRSLPHHAHDTVYVSLVLKGSYTELADFVPRLCSPGTLLLHPSEETHSDYFHSPGLVLNGDWIADQDPPSDLTGAFLPIANRYCPHITPLVDRAPHSWPEWLFHVCDVFDWYAPRPLAAAALIAGKHPTDFSRAFRRFTGTSPGRFRRRVRIRHAIRKILETPERLAAISADCGFADQSHFSRAFQSETGMTPRSFARSFRR